MPAVRCPRCKARYEVAVDAGGRRSQCRKCGQIFRIPPLQQPAPEPSAQAGVDTIELEELTPPAPPHTLSDDVDPVFAIPLTDMVSYATGAPGLARVAAKTAYAGYFRSLVHSLSFPIRLGDFIVFVIGWVILVVGNLAAVAQVCVGAAAYLIVQGWYMAFQLNVVVGAAAGEEELPAFSLTDGCGTASYCRSSACCSRRS